ncbi:SDR family NAD(P)-dependent oxidoreductase [Variovorax sp. M-6]|uniref:SDR family NAD(P)-dependent oxidoreductase n=1 Tax=Variovorax sp. M-6 TaxID=3233041 RepID=UPI003F9C36DB
MSDMASYPSLRQRTVFISGGGSGIGASLVEHFVRQGARVGFVDIATEPSHALCERLAGEGLQRPHFVPCDVSDIAALQNAIAAVAASFGDVDVLINNAANDERHALEALTPERWQQLMDVNLRHHAFAAQAVIDGMRRKRAGSIINMSSVTWLKGTPGLPAYVAAKAAIVGLTKALAREFGVDGVRVNALLPGWIMTERQVSRWLTPEAEARLLQNQCLKEKLYPEDIARMALFLAADDSRLISAQSFIVDGGAT